MKLEIVRVLDFGSHDSERVELRVVSNCNLHRYILTDTTYTDATHISNKLRHMHWFGKQDMITGDEVVLYTKKGTDSSAALGNGNTCYIRYWGLGNSVWNNTGDAALLFEIEDWNTTKVRNKYSAVEIKRQVKIPLTVNGVFIANYYMDFRTVDKHGGIKYIEVKGLELPLWKMKWRLLTALIVDIDKGAELLIIKQ